MVWALNYLLVSGPISSGLASDPRNSAFTIRAHYRFYVDPTTLILDLKEADAAAPVDLLRGLFQSADAMHQHGRGFQTVVLARNGRPTFTMQGTDFDQIGAEFAMGQNPIYLSRTLPEKLQTPSGAEAFGHWQGGWLGVVGKQMDDVNRMARMWAAGQ